MDWHDSHVHGLFIVRGQDGTGSLILDIDYILEWDLPKGEKVYRHLIAPATLTFVSMYDLKLHLDYRSCGTSPFSIDGIERQANLNPYGHSTYAWRIPVNFPSGEISFVASGFKQALRAAPIWNGICLDPEQRVPF